MLTRSYGRGVACNIAILLVSFAVQSAADETTSDITPRQTVPRLAESLAPAKQPLVSTGGFTEIVYPAAGENGLPPSKSTREPRAAWSPPARFFTINQVLSKHQHNPSSNASMRLAAVNPTDRASDSTTIRLPPTRGDEPFGLFTFKAPEGLLWGKWRKVKSDLQAAMPALSRCLSNHDDCTPGASRFVAIVDQTKVSHGRARLEFVNRKINSEIRYVSDMTQWGALDRWSAPLNADKRGSFDTGLGDCEDYAIAKYVALREAGVPDKNLRILLVRDNNVRMDHAVLAARENGRWVILDNRRSALIEEEDAQFLTLLFAIDNSGVKFFAAPYASYSLGRQLVAYSTEIGQTIAVGAEENGSDILPTYAGGSAGLPLLM
jgi:predicted transglutaminase-like cysteine proteinase